MPTRSQLSTQRATAGARYTAAVAELHASLVDLAALDRVLNNANVTPVTMPSPTFGDLPEGQGNKLTHPVYAPYSTKSWRDEVDVAAAVYLAGFAPGP